MSGRGTSPAGVSVIVPVYNKLAFTAQCLERLGRHLPEGRPVEVVVVDNASTDGTAAFFAAPPAYPFDLRYHRAESNLGFARANNLGARLASHDWLLFLNNDTIALPDWMAEMLAVALGDPKVGVVGIKQLFPYTNRIHHTGIVFVPGGLPQHIHAHADARLPHVNRQREYQAVTGACMLMPRDLFEACEGFDEAYVNGYEDVDLCLKVGERGRKVVCCTRAAIYHYGMVSDARTAHDDRNAARFLERWGRRVRSDSADYAAADRAGQGDAAPAPRDAPSVLTLRDEFYFADDLSRGSAFSWVDTELALALLRMGADVRIRKTTLQIGTEREAVEALEPLMVPTAPVGGVQVKWSHFWPQHLNVDLDGDLNLELFAVNYRFGAPGSQPWDYWLQCLSQTHTHKLAISEFCRQVLLQCGVPEDQAHVWHPGYSREIERVGAPRRPPGPFRFLSVTNSHDLERYGTRLLLDAYWDAFGPAEDVVLVLKDYGVGATDKSIRKWLAEGTGRARVEYVREFTSKARLIELYRSCDAFVSPHRGEGFGMKVLDAMACGMPVILPLYGGPADYCQPENAVPVRFTEVPLGDGLDRRSLPIANAPMWCEPDRVDLAAQLRATFGDRPRAALVAARARQDVRGRFSWDEAARRLLTLTDELRRRARADQAPMAAPAVHDGRDEERSPYWMGVRMSAVVPTHDRLEKLKRCLAAFERQTVLPQELEVVVVDDGSTDGTSEWLQAYRPPFRLVTLRQDNRGPGAARTLGLSQAQGEHVLFVGDDTYPAERLVEEHLLAHAEWPEPHVAVLGHIDWPAAPPPNAVMRYVAGRGMLQFAYDHIPNLPALDYRFFYTSNVSLKRAFLADAAAAGVTFDRCFRYAAFEDSEFAWRLERRGLEIVYRAGARAEHDHWMDLESFGRREFHAGQMAVVFYRKHPQVDSLLQVRWIGDQADVVEDIARQPDVLERLRAFDRDSDDLLRALVKLFESLLALGETPGRIRSSEALSPGRLERRLQTILMHVFEVQRTRGKIEEWYRDVLDPAKVEAAKTVHSALRKIEFLGRDLGDLERVKDSLGWLDSETVRELRERVRRLEHEFSAVLGRRAGGLGRRLRQRAIPPRLSQAIVPPLFALDARVRAFLTRRGWFGTLDRYGRLRTTLRRLLR